MLACLLNPCRFTCPVICAKYSWWLYMVYSKTHYNFERRVIASNNIDDVYTTPPSPAPHPPLWKLGSVCSDGLWCAACNEAQEQQWDSLGLAAEVEFLKTRLFETQVVMTAGSKEAALCQCFTVDIASSA